MTPTTRPTGAARRPGRNLDLTGASLANGAGQHADGKIDVKNLSSLHRLAGVGGPDASWLLRWTVITPGQTGNGHIYYVGMDNNAGAGGSGSPTFFAGDTAPIPVNNPGEHTKYFAYPQTHVLSASQASYDKTTGVITINVPLSDVGNPADGTRAVSRHRVQRHLADAPVGGDAVQPHRRHDAVRAGDRSARHGRPAGRPVGLGSGSGGGSGGSSGPTGGHGRCPAATGRLTARGARAG